MPSKLTARLNRTTQPDPTTARQRLNSSEKKLPTDEADLKAAFPGTPSWQVTTVEKATPPAFSQRAIEIAALPSGGPRGNAARARVVELRQSQEWQDEAHPLHKSAVNEFHALYDIIIEDQTA